MCEESNGESSFRFKVPFAPRVVTRKVENLFSVDTVSGKESPRWEQCMLCSSTVQTEAFVVLLDNGPGDVMEVGYCCTSHDSTSIRARAVREAFTKLRIRQTACALLDSETLEIVEA